MTATAAVAGRRGRSAPGAESRERAIALAIFIGFLVLCWLGGGASRGDVMSLLYLRPAAVATIAALLLLPLHRDWRSYRSLLMLLGGLAALMVLQLVPLPPSWWLALPGREVFEPAARAAGLAQPWRPLSLTPDRTFQALLTLLFPLATVVAFASLDAERGRKLLIVVIGGIVLSAALGVLQLTAGERSSFHLYTITHRGSAVGFFANRNHQAALLAMALPMLRVWTMLPGASGSFRRTRDWLALGLSLFLVAMILVTGSRAGLALGLLGLVAAAVIAPASPLAGGGRKQLAVLAVIALPLVTTAVVFILGRAQAIQRLLPSSASDPEMRFEYMPLMSRIVGDYLPFGTGFGSFDPIFRIYEPDRVLGPQFFNHAHNEIVELAITGGLPALAVAGLFLVWYVHGSYRVLRLKPNPGSALFGRLGVVMVLFLLLASLVDYPLRTPLMGVVFTIACCWIAQGQRSRRVR